MFYLPCKLRACCVLQTSMSEVCIQLQQLRDDLKATEEKTFSIVSSDYLVDVKT